MNPSGIKGRSTNADEVVLTLPVTGDSTKMGTATTSTTGPPSAFPRSRSAGGSQGGGGAPAGDRDSVAANPTGSGEVGADTRDRWERFGDWLIQPMNFFFILFWMVFVASGSVAIWGAADRSNPPKTFLYIWDPNRMVEANLQCVNLILALAAVAQHPARILDTKYWLVEPSKLTKRYVWYGPSRYCVMGIILFLLQAACVVEYAACIVLWFTPRTEGANHTVAVLIPLHLALQFVPTLWSMLLTALTKSERQNRNAPVPPAYTPPMTPERRTSNISVTSTQVRETPAAVQHTGNSAKADVAAHEDLKHGCITAAMKDVNEHKEDEPPESPATKAVTPTAVKVGEFTDISLIENDGSPNGAKSSSKQANSSGKSQVNGSRPSSSGPAAASGEPSANPYARTYTIKGHTFTIPWDVVADWLIEWKNLLLVMLGLLVVVTGTMLFFAFIYIIPFKDSAVKMDFIESNAQILNMLFSVVALANHPVRMMDTYYFLTHKTARLQKRYPWFVDGNLEIRKAMRTVLILLQGNCFGQYLSDVGMWSKPMCCRWIPALVLGMPSSFVCGILGGILVEKYKRQFSNPTPNTPENGPVATDANTSGDGIAQDGAEGGEAGGTTATAAPLTLFATTTASTSAAGDALLPRGMTSLSSVEIDQSQQPLPAAALKKNPPRTPPPAIPSGDKL